MKLKRIESNDFATYGHLTDDDGKVISCTLELPWRDNAEDVSCIPPGTYTALRFTKSKRGYDVFKLTDVPNRSDVELHIGNIPENSTGCVLLGDAFGTIETEAGNEAGIVRSKPAFDRFMALMRGRNAFTLTVIDPDR